MWFLLYWSYLGFTEPLESVNVCPWPLFLQIFFPLHFLSSKTLVPCMLNLLIVSFRFQGLCSFSVFPQSFFSKFFRLDNFIDLSLIFLTLLSSLSYWSSNPVEILFQIFYFSLEIFIWLFFIPFVSLLAFPIFSLTMTKFSFMSLNIIIALQSPCLLITTSESPLESASFRFLFLLRVDYILMFICTSSDFRLCRGHCDW